MMAENITVNMGVKMSIFRCEVCGENYDSDYTEMLDLDGLEVCEDCFLENGGEE